MKKQLKTTLLAAALLVSVTTAFASNIANAITGKKLAPYSWQKYDRNTGNPVGTPVTSATNPFPECSGFSEPCTIGTDLDSQAGEQIILRYD